MPRDYAKKSRPKKTGASRQQGQPLVPKVVWVATVFFVVGLCGGLSYLKFFAPQKSVSTPATAQNTKQSSNKTSDKSTKTGTPPKPSAEQVPIYNVHQDLTNKEVEIPAEDLKLDESQDKYQYIMPCGSFREQSRAEELKALIALTGHNSEIQAVDSHGETWYRVQMGPYNRKRSAEAVRHRLQDNNINDCRIIPRLKS